MRRAALVVMVLVLILGVTNCSRHSSAPRSSGSTVISDSRSSAGWRMTLELPASSFRVGRPYFATVSLSNVSSVPATVALVDGRAFELQVLPSAASHGIPYGTHGLPTSVPGHHLTLRRLAPGAVLRQRVPFQFSAPGAYEIDALPPGTAPPARADDLQPSLQVAAGG